MGAPRDAGLIRDQGLEKAIVAAGGVRALARRLGVSQPTISNWKRVPAERVLSVEELTGIARQELRPDIYPNDDGSAIEIDTLALDTLALDEVDQARAENYALVGRLLWRAPTVEDIAALSVLRGDASEIGLARLSLAGAAASADVDALGREFFRLFVGVGRGEFLPYASYYLTGFLHERPLARVREDLARLGVVRDGRTLEPEDHISILFDVMAGLVTRRFEAEGIDEQVFFDRHIKPWAARFFVDLELADAGEFYRCVGTLGRRIVEIEEAAFSMAA
jgi:TorA maturation chaperone TorD